jgi:cytochrome P450
MVLDESMRLRPPAWAIGRRAIAHADASRPRAAFLPFGAGSRMCIGEGLARVEAVLLVATIARRWRPRLLRGHPVELQPAVTLRPKHGMMMTLERRRP